MTSIGVRCSCSLFGSSPAVIWSLEYAEAPKSLASRPLGMPAYFRNSEYSGIAPLLLRLHSTYFCTHVSAVHSCAITRLHYTRPDQSSVTNLYLVRRGDCRNLRRPHSTDFVVNEAG